MSMKEISSLQVLLETFAHSKKYFLSMYLTHFFSNAELLIFLLLPSGSNQVFNELIDKGKRPSAPESITCM